MAMTAREWLQVLLDQIDYERGADPGRVLN
jgi:hypothetical protein